MFFEVLFCFIYFIFIYLNRISEANQLTINNLFRVNQFLTHLMVLRIHLLKN